MNFFPGRIMMITCGDCGAKFAPREKHECEIGMRRRRVLAAMTRTDSDWASTVRCPCGSSLTWGETAALNVWLDAHAPHVLGGAK